MTQTALAPTRGDNVRAIVKRILCFALFVAALIATFRTAWIVSTTLLDSDASSSLLLGEKLSREGGILSTTFIYATELYVVDVQIIYSLLFRICSDWSLVRFWGAVIMQVLMIAAYGYLAKQARMSLNMFFVSAAALLLPFSVPYGRIVLYHNFYMPHVTLGFLTVGLYMGVASEKAAGRVWWKNAIRGGLLCLVAFLWGLSGVRPLMICAAPLAVAAVLTGVLGEKRENRIRPECGALLWAAAMVAAMAAGYLVNANVLSNIYDFRRYDSQTLILASPEKREQIFRGFLAAGGYQDEIELFEPHGFLAVTSVAAAMIGIVLSFLTLRRTKDRAARFLSLFYLMTVLITTCVFLFLGNQEFLYLLYYLPAIVWIIPALAKADVLPLPEAEKLSRENWKEQVLGLKSPKLSLYRLTALVACGMLLCGGAFYTGFFRHPETYEGNIEYTGLNVFDTDTVEKLQPVADYLRENGYTLGYASYWDAAVIMELTDGQTRMTAVEGSGRRKPLKYMNWLSDTELRDPGWAAQQKTVLVADIDNISPYITDSEELMENLERKEGINGYVIYELKDPAYLANMMN